ncbi:MAG: DUF4342 domain-containing protein [Ardenticatenaceae bacterium]
MSTQADTTQNKESEVREVSASKLAESLEEIMAAEDVNVVVIYKNKKQRREMSGNELLESVERIVDGEEVSRLIITKANGETFLDVSLSGGLVITVFATFLFPKLVGLGVVGALLARFKVEIVPQKVKTVDIAANQAK